MSHCHPTYSKDCLLSNGPFSSTITLSSASYQSAIQVPLPTCVEPISCLGSLGVFSVH